MNKLNRSQGEQLRLEEDRTRKRNWKRWGPYLSERQWGTVREDYSSDGSAWDYFPHDHARRRAYRWGEDGLLGITDRQCRLCFGLALWNHRDPILKERLFGLTGPEGNHGEDVKECYYYLDSSPTHSYMQALYKYPQSEYPYDLLLEVNRSRGLQGAEFELMDTGIFADDRYFDVTAEYAKRSDNDILIKVTVANRAAQAASISLLPTIWFRNTWSWGCAHEGCTRKPTITLTKDGVLLTEHETLGKFLFAYDKFEGAYPEVLFTDNITNNKDLFDGTNEGPYTKDAFHRFLIDKETEAVNPKKHGTKAAPLYTLQLEPKSESTFCFRLASENEVPQQWFGAPFSSTFEKRIEEHNQYLQEAMPAEFNSDQQLIARQAYAGLLWTKQFYHYVVQDWLAGDPNMPTPPKSRFRGRNHEWRHLFNRDVISMPDKWEYPWYAAWDLAFHMIPFAKIDPVFAKEQLILFLREWYLHPNGQLPAYEFALSDVNPPVHAWAAWRIYKMTGARGDRDQAFLESVFQKLLLNFTWWVNRKDLHGRNVFSGGFLGMDNVGVFDRSRPLPTGGHLEQADGTAWMAFYCLTMLAIALELAQENVAYEDMASKFFEHYIAIADAINTLGETGLWNDEDSFYYDQLRLGDSRIPLKTRSMVGLLPLIAVEVLEQSVIESLPGFNKRLNWFLENRQDLARHVSFCNKDNAGGRRLLSIPSLDRLKPLIRYLLDEAEFLSPYGIRSVSKFHERNPYVFRVGFEEHRVEYVPGESNSYAFGGNSNWRGPIWFPINFLLIEALERYHHFYGDSLKFEFPTGSGEERDLKWISNELSRRVGSIFEADPSGRRPCHGREARYAKDPHWQKLVLFHEYFHGDLGVGLGASHQTGWTALAVRFLEKSSRGLK